MELSSDLVSLQGILTSADNKYKLSTINFGDKTEKVTEIIETVSNLLKRLEYIDEKGLLEGKEQYIRKIAFYIVLNSDLPSLSRMVEIDGLETVIWTVPTISKYMMCELCWNLYMDQFIYEIISLCLPEFSLEVATAFIKSIKYFRLDQTFKKVKLLTCALLRLLGRTVFFKMESNHLNEILNSIYVNFLTCVNYFTQPLNSEELTNLTEFNKYKHIGNCLYAMVQSINESLDHFSVELLEPDDLYVIYRLTYNDKDINRCSEDRDSALLPILDSFIKCQIALLDGLQEIILTVTINTFCCWSECEINGKTLQEKIGQECYKLHEKLLDFSALSEHPVVSLLETISRKPESIDDKINKDCSEDIINMINNSCDDEVKTDWLNALINKENICNEIALLEELNKNLHLLNEQSCHKLFVNVEKYLNQNNITKTHEYLQDISIKAFKKCNTSTKFLILQNRFKDKKFIDMQETTNFSTVMTETFNKLIISPDTDLCDILELFLQSPQKVFQNIIEYAVQNVQHSKIMLNVMEFLKTFIDHYYRNDTEPCVIKHIRNIFNMDLNNKNLESLTTFLDGLKKKNIIFGTNILLLIVMPLLHSALKTNSIKVIYAQIKILSTIYREEILTSTYRAPMLAIIAQILEVLRWDWSTFTPLRPVTLDLSLDILNTLLSTNGPPIPEKDVAWLKLRISKLNDYNRYYYRQLWDQPLRGNMLEVISRHRIYVMPSGSFISFIVIMLVRSTVQEWYMIWDCLYTMWRGEVLNNLHLFVVLMTQWYNMNRDENKWQCLLYAYSNYISIIRYKYFADVLTAPQVTEIIGKIIHLVNFIQDEKIEESGNIFLPLIAYIVENNDDHRVNVADQFRVQLEHTRKRKFLDIISSVTVK